MIPREIIEDHIYLLRKHKVMFDFHLAVLYNVETRALKQQVKRNIHRFPKDFMFELNNKEIDIMVSQFVIPSKQYLGGSRPMVFTEQGVAMLSSVLKSERAMLVNIEIMRTYVKIRQILFSHKELARKIRELELRYDAKFKVVFTAINDLMNPVYLNKGDFGFKVKESKIKYLPKITTTKR
ncbi:MAG: ORF6N domain-containing protein [Ignavibacteriae bacterium]|nr:MAG: ORF6N domain-containing protein [Ignavibacteriota bacterium]